MAEKAKTIGLLLMATSIVLLVAGFFEWYFFFISGGFLFLTIFNKSKGINSLLNVKNTKQAIHVYSLFALVGLSVELVRIFLHLWDYTGMYNQSIVVIVWVLILYPLFFAFIFEKFSFFNGKTKNRLMSGIITLLLLIIWNEVPNIFLPMWIINPNYDPVFIYSLSFIGYIYELGVAMGADYLLRKHA